MHRDEEFVEARLDRFILNHIRPAIYRDRHPLSASAWQVTGEPVPFKFAVTQNYQPVDIGWLWGRPWSTVWFKVQGEIPAHWKKGIPENTTMEILVDFGYNRSRSGFQAEGLAYALDGSILKAISPLNSWLPWSVRNGEINFLIEAAANPDIAGEYDFLPTPYGDWESAPTAPLYKLVELNLALRDLPVWELNQDIWTLQGLMRALPKSGSRRHKILRGFEDALDLLDPNNISGTAEQAREILRPILDQPANATSHNIVATGHAHIDSAWLWPLRETVRKCARTFSNVLSLMDEYPDFIFSCSSAQQYQWISIHYPELFKRIKAKVAAGQWIPVGGMWVESDTIMPGSEALARQFIYGKLFFQDNFGVDCQEAWLPDSFGYSGALPQIVSLSGEKWFLSQKMSWNQINKMPHHTFWWEGIDGTKVFTHFPPVDTYISELSGSELSHAEENFSEKGRANISLVPFGWGDGGGGPTREMIAAAHRTANLEGSPRVTLGSPANFFQSAHAEYPNAPTWRGEMYLELHRGVLTSQHRTKQGNRKSQALLYEAELWATTATLRTGIPYPTTELREGWETLLLLQFHDILPGTSIAWVHRETERKYEDLITKLEIIIKKSLAELSKDSEGVKSKVFVHSSPISGVTKNRTPLAFTVATEQSDRVKVKNLAIGTELENCQLKVIIDGHGRLISLISKKGGRETISTDSPANILFLHDDLPNLWDAWDIDAHYFRTVNELAKVDDYQIKIEIDSTVIITTTRKLVHETKKDTVIEQLITLRPGANEVDLDYRIDWHETQKLLKLSFPFDLHTEQVAAETQFGHVWRSTHTNTSWDAARFEACQHRFLFISEPGYGVAIANDSCYGYDVARGTRADGGTTTTVRFSLLRAPLFPDPESDQGIHELKFQLRPAATIGEAIGLGFDLAHPTREVAAASPMRPLISSSSPAVIINTVKLAEDGSGDLIVRLYEAWGGRAQTDISVDGIAEVIECTDLLERRLEIPVVTDGSIITLEFRPFQIRTLRFRGLAL
jgi:alpha-mannosidase